MAVERRVQAPHRMFVPLVDVCDTEWRELTRSWVIFSTIVPLVDVCDTEWRYVGTKSASQFPSVPLVDVCDTEWRVFRVVAYSIAVVPLVDVCDTEWRGKKRIDCSKVTYRATR